MHRFIIFRLLSLHLWQYTVLCFSGKMHFIQLTSLLSFNFLVLCFSVAVLSLADLICWKVLLALFSPLDLLTTARYLVLKPAIFDKSSPRDSKCCHFVTGRIQVRNSPASSHCHRSSQLQMAQIRAIRLLFNTYNLCGVSCSFEHLHDATSAFLSVRLDRNDQLSKIHVRYVLCSSGLFAVVSVAFTCSFNHV